jgi:hypothetical protein
MAVHQTVEYANSGRLTDGGRDSGDCGVCVFCIHTSIVDELLMSGNWQTAECASKTVFDRADDPSRRNKDRRHDCYGVDPWPCRFTGQIGHQETSNDDNLHHPLPD